MVYHVEGLGLYTNKALAIRDCKKAREEAAAHLGKYAPEAQVKVVCVDTRKIVWPEVKPTRGFF